MGSFIKILLVSTGLFLLSQYANAFGGGDNSSFGIGLMTTSPSQDDLDSYISSSTSGMSKFSSGLEFFGQYSYRFSGSIFAIQFRPSYLTQNTSGGGNKIDLTGFTFFPMLKFFPLESNFIKFFMQAGVGYGTLNGAVTRSDGSSVNFSGSAFGTVAGLGAEFCFTPSHCAVLEGNVRYLPIQRNVASSVSGNPGFSQNVSGQELEYAGSDVKTTMSGIQGGISYAFYF